MNIEDLTIKQVTQIAEMAGKFSSPPNVGGEKKLIGQWVIVRCRDAGVHFGKLVSYEGREVVLSNSRRMYYWVAKSGHTLSGCAKHGIEDASKITAEIKTIILPEACEIIECEKAAVKTIGGADEHNS